MNLRTLLFIIITDVLYNTALVVTQG